MLPALLQQFRLFYDTGVAAQVNAAGQTTTPSIPPKPIGVVLWASVSAEVAETLARGTTKMRPQDWRSGDRLWVVQVIAPFGGAEQMVVDLKAKVFPDREIRFLRVTAAGGQDVGVV